MPAKRKRRRRPTPHVPPTEHDLVALLERSRRLREQAAESIDYALRIRAQIHEHCLEDLSVIERDRREMSPLRPDADDRPKSI